MGGRDGNKGLIGRDSLELRARLCEGVRLEVFIPSCRERAMKIQAGSHGAELFYRGGVWVHGRINAGKQQKSCHCREL